MIDIRGIENTPVYKLCLLRRGIIKMIQHEVERLDFTLQSKDLGALYGLLVILNRELKLIGVPK